MEVYIILFCGAGLYNLLYNIKCSKNKSPILIDKNKYKVIDKQYYKLQMIAAFASFINIIICSNLIENLGLYSAICTFGYILSVYLLKLVAIKKNFIREIYWD